MGNVTTGFDLLTLVGLIGAIVGALTSLRLLGPNRKKVIVETADITSQSQDRLIGRYRELLLRADEQLSAQADRIEQLEVREDECEKRNEFARLEILELTEKVERLEATLRRHGLNGP